MATSNAVTPYPAALACVCCVAALSVCLLSQEECNASLARVKKDAKLMPALVYAMEGWEKQLVSTGQPPPTLFCCKALVGSGVSRLDQVFRSLHF